jgi:hypothetical protein
MRVCRSLHPRRLELGDRVRSRRGVMTKGQEKDCERMETYGPAKAGHYATRTGESRTPN